MVFHPMAPTKVKADLMNAIDINDYKAIARRNFGIDAGLAEGVAQLYTKADLLQAGGCEECVVPFLPDKYHK